MAGGEGLDESSLATYAAIAVGKAGASAGLLGSATGHAAPPLVASESRSIYGAKLADQFSSVSPAWGGTGGPAASDAAEGAAARPRARAIDSSRLAIAIHAFRKYDKDGDGTLQYEFAAAIREMLNSRAGDRPAAPARGVPSGGCGPLEDDRFRRAIRLFGDKRRARRCDPPLVFDLEADGCRARTFRRRRCSGGMTRIGEALSPRSFGAVVGKLALADGHKYTDAELEELRAADLDADGEVDFHELLKLARQKRVLKAQRVVDEARKARQIAAEVEAAAALTEAEHEAARREEARREAEADAAERLRREAEQAALEAAEPRKRAERASEHAEGVDLAYGRCCATRSRSPACWRSCRT